MSSGDLRELYQQVILDHNRNPRNFKELPAATKKVEGYNPLCGDHYTVFIELDGDVIKDISFTGNGCAISKSSASVMTSTVKGKRTQDAEKLFEIFHKLVMGDPGDLSAEELGRLAAFSGVSELPARVKCATLAWHTLHNALHGGAGSGDHRMTTKTLILSREDGEGSATQERGGFLAPLGMRVDR